MDDALSPVSPTGRSKNKLFFGVVVLLTVLCFIGYTVNTKRNPAAPKHLIESDGNTQGQDVGRYQETTLTIARTITVSNYGNKTDDPVLSSADYQLKQAAYKIRKSPVPASYMFASDLYFHPQLTRRDENSGAPLLPEILINPAAVCSGSGSGPGPQSSSSGQKESDKDVFLVVTVLSSYLKGAEKERRIIRNTYGSVVRSGMAVGNAVWPGRKSLPARLALVFLLGKPPNDTQRQEVQEEHDRFGDLVVADFVDSYQNLTLKVLTGLHWALTNCPTAKYIFKTDDDTFVHLPLLTNFLVYRGENNAVYGTAYLAATVLRNGRWRVPEHAFPFPMYPAYMSGTGYVLSVDAARKVLVASKVVPRIPIEDAYITGILAQVAHIRRISCSGFTSYIEKQTKACAFLMDKKLVGNEMSAPDKERLWTSLRIGDRRSCL